MRRASRDPRQATRRLLESPDFLDWAVHVSAKHRYLYVVNPKVGCSSILWSLRRFELGDPDLVPARVRDIHERAGSPLLRPSDVGGSHALLRNAGYFKFTFVRNPFERLMSCYLQKIAARTEQRAAVLRLLGRSESDTGEVAFAEFVAAIAGQSPDEMDPHWRVQVVQTVQDHAAYDYIGRFERFDRDLAAIGARISPELSRFVYTERRQATGKKPYHLIEGALAETIRKVYAEDFERFSYPLEVPSA
jgi:hypothetical protein